MDDKLLVSIVLRALSKTYCTFVTTLDILNQTPGFHELVNMLQQEESSHANLNEEEYAMMPKQRGKKLSNKKVKARISLSLMTNRRKVV